MAGFWDGFNQQRAADDQSGMVALNQLAQVGSMANQRQQMQMHAMQMEEALRKQKQERGLEAAFGASIGPQGIDRSIALRELAKVSPLKALEYQSKWAEDDRKGRMEGFDKINPKDYTPESVAQFAQTRDFSALKPVRKMEVGPAGQVYDAYNIKPGQVLADPNKPFSIGANGQAMPNEAYQGYEFGKAERSAARHNTVVKLPPLEGEEQKEKGKLNVKTYGEVADAARASQKLGASIDTQLRQLDNGFKTGFGAEAKAAAANVLGSLGVKDAEKYATNAQTFKGAATDVVLQKQLLQKGPQTESDAKRIADTGAQLGNTPDANKFILTVAKTQANRDVSQQRFFDKYWRENKTYEGAENAWYSGEGGKSLFDAPELRGFSASPKPAAQTSNGPRSVSGKVGGVNPANLSNAELLRELGAFK